MPAKPPVAQLEEVALDAKDGSTAGANAVTMDEVRNLPQSSGSASTSGSAEPGQRQSDSGTSGGGGGSTDYGGGGYYTESYGY